MQTVLTALFKNIGYNEDPNENDFTKFLRQEAARWACTLNATECIHIAKEKLDQYLTYPAENKLLPWWKHWTYCKGIISANNTIWSKLFRKYGKNHDQNIIEAIAYYKKFRVIKICLQCMSKENNIITNVQHRVYGFFSIVAKHARHNEILTYLLSNFEEIKPKEVNMIAALAHIINHVYTRKQIWKIRAFVEKEFADNAHAYLTIKHKIRSRWYKIRRQLIYLTNF